MNRLESDLLRTFVAIADSGSFSRAAGVVGRSQSAISMQIKRLEEVAGATLFMRGARGIRLTPPGESLLIKARAIVALLDQAADELRADPLEGTVRIGIPEEYGATILPAVLARFAETHPAVQVTVRCEPSPACEAALARGELDLALLVIDSGGGEGQLLAHDPTVWVTSARHAAHEQDPVPVAMFEPDCWWRDWALKALNDRGRRYRIAYTSRSIAGLQAAVTSGLAIAVLAQSTMPAGSRMLTAEEGFTALPGSAIVLRRRPAAGARAVAGMAEALREAFLRRAARRPLDRALSRVDAAATYE